MPNISVKSVCIFISKEVLTTHRLLLFSTVSAINCFRVVFLEAVTRMQSRFSGASIAAINSFPSHSRCLSVTAHSTVLCVIPSQLLDEVRLLSQSFLLIQ